MFDHVTLKVCDLDAAVRFYTDALAALGHMLCSHDATTAGFGPPGEPALWLMRADGPSGPGAHVAFRAETRGAVAQFHEAGLAAGGRDHGAPGLRTDYAATYYAAFLLDPDGNNVEAVCLR
jgi:catechol 2,3-dioxygenase-like lactoylglutathione lyase family enzyme